MLRIKKRLCRASRVSCKHRSLQSTARNGDTSFNFAVAEERNDIEFNRDNAYAHISITYRGEQPSKLDENGEESRITSDSHNTESGIVCCGNVQFCTKINKYKCCVDVGDGNETKVALNSDDSFKINRNFLGLYIVTVSRQAEDLEYETVHSSVSGENGMTRPLKNKIVSRDIMTILQRDENFPFLLKKNKNCNKRHKKFRGGLRPGRRS